MKTWIVGLLSIVVMSTSLGCASNRGQLRRIKDSKLDQHIDREIEKGMQYSHRKNDKIKPLK